MFGQFNDIVKSATSKLDKFGLSTEDLIRIAMDKDKKTSREVPGFSLDQGVAVGIEFGKVEEFKNTKIAEDRVGVLEIALEEAKGRVLKRGIQWAVGGLLGGSGIMGVIQSFFPFLG